MKKQLLVVALFSVSMIAAVGSRERGVRAFAPELAVRDEAAEVARDGGEYEVMAGKKPVGACPSDMVEVNANYCSQTDETCLFYQTLEGVRTNIDTGRCGEFRKPVHCLVAPVKRHFCIGKFEAQNKEGELPQDWISFNKAKKLAEEKGNRLCTGSEWTTAASGNEYLPIPYGKGYIRSGGQCNLDKRIHGVDVMHVSDPNSPGAIALRAMVVPSGSMPACISSTGVMDMSANLDEWTINESGKPYVSGLKGGEWSGVRNRSTPMTTAHSPSFYWYETSYRMCRDIQVGVP